MTSAAGARHVLVVNAGSSSLKYRVVAAATGETVADGTVSEIGGDARLRHEAGGHRAERSVACPTHAEAFTLARESLDEHGPDLGAGLVAVGHRVVHGGERFTEAVEVSDDVLAALRELAPLAPLHNPANVEGIVRAREAFPGVPHVAVFDTAFHRTLAPAAHTYAVPRAWREEHAVRRYGFHGTSFASVSRRTAALLGRPVEDLALVVLHLGNGASACAVLGGRSVDTSMGLSPTEGLVMGTRSGDVDPALGAYLARVAGTSVEDYETALNRRSGLLALAGASDFRTLEEGLEAGDEDARLAFDVTVHRLVKYVGAYAAVLGRLDALVFTGGIGEHSPVLRAAVVGRLGVLGLVLDEGANADGTAARRVSADASAAGVWVVPTDEEAEIARAALEVAGARS
ncbi:acetate/propionate family kinase [Oryzobacter terrae]|uniref:acetate/propionate family kinase n=1 Tax=Oryzobacter terrae TaxID=1620385 RepID=UPI00366B64E8